MFIKIKDNKSKGFTLAEVLLTLTIVGVVASISIPSLMSDFRKKQTATLLKQTYSIIQQVFSKYMLDNGCLDDLNCKGIFDGGNTNFTSYDEIRPYFNVVKDCGTATDKNCFAGDVNATYLNGDPWLYGSVDEYLGWKVILSNGVSLQFYSGSMSGCSYNHGQGALEKACGNIHLDVNGTKPPNRVGKDIFVFETTGSGMVYPFGININNYNRRWNGSNSHFICDPDNPSARGNGCAGRIMEEGWEINY